MEWVPGDLRRYDLKRCEISPLLYQVSSGLAFMHAHQFVHRDLKPENILVQDAERFCAKIADFGLSKWNVFGEMQSYAGSTAYMAPEIPKRKGYTSAVDMWSLGVIAVEVLTEWDITAGPGQGIPSEEWIHESVLPRIGHAPEKFRDLLQVLLSEDAKARLTAAQCVSWLQLCAGPTDTSEHHNEEQECHADVHRHVRSAHPTLSQTRADKS